MTSCDVAIVGMGPVGVSLAGLLGCQGVTVIALDKADSIYDKPRAIGLDHEVMRVFQQIGAADDLAPFLSAYPPSEYRTREGEVIRRFISAPPPYPLSWPPYQTFLQPKLEDVLRRHVSAMAGVSLRTGSEVVAIDGTELTLADGTRVKARYVVGCDGGNSFVRKALGIRFEDLVFDDPWLVVDMRVEDASGLPDTIVQYCDPERPTTFIGGPGDLYRWEFRIMPGEDPAEMATDASVWRLLAPWLGPSQARIWRAATYRFHAVVAERWRNGNVFLAGDACHMTPPFLAQGMTQGIKDAANLAWKLSAAIQGAPDRLLDTYETERRPFVREVITITKALGAVICETDERKANARNAALRKDMVEGRGETVRQNLFPPIKDTPLCIASHIDGVGRPVPQPMIRMRNAAARLDDVTGHGFRLLSAGMVVDEALLKRLSVAHHVIGPGGLDETDTLFADWLSGLPGKAVLVRPDHVVMAVIRNPEDLVQAMDVLKAHLPNSTETPA